MSGRMLRATLAGVGLLLIAILGNASASSNDVATSAVSEHAETITANDLAPAACSSLALVNVIAGSGTVNGTVSNDLILGSGAADTLNANAGNDCVVGGGGDDIIDGSDGLDTCLGGPGTNTLTACE